MNTKLDFAVARVSLALMALQPGALVESEQANSVRIYLRALDDALAEAFPDVATTAEFTDRTDGFLLGHSKARDGK